MHRPIFILGMRASGTSVTWQLIAGSPDVEDILFEPHDLYAALMLTKTPRFAGSAFLQAARQPLEEMLTRQQAGAKFALNPGIEALRWHWILQPHPDAAVVFLRRNCQDNFASWRTKDSEALPYSVFEYFWRRLLEIAEEKGAYILDYDALIQDPKKRIDGLFSSLGIRAPVDAEQLIRKPRHFTGSAAS